MITDLRFIDQSGLGRVQVCESPHRHVKLVAQRLSLCE